VTDFLLLHGMCVGAWEWERLTPLLRADPRVRSVVAPDMPGRGANRPGGYAAIRIDDYTATALDALRSHDLRDAIVVGHSGGGAYLQAVVAAEPERVRRMVFLCAAVPENGHSLLDLQPRPLRFVSRLFMRLLRTGSRGIRPNGRLARRAVCNDLTPADCAMFLDRLVPEPEALLLGRISWRAERVRAPATYILTTRDQTIPPKDQRRAASRVPRAELVRLEMGHARPVAEPGDLAALLLNYVV
jgi:pimeloyl-ACP methyl ester carboxylesterase